MQQEFRAIKNSPLVCFPQLQGEKKVKKAGGRIFLIKLKERDRQSMPRVLNASMLYSSGPFLPVIFLKVSVWFAVASCLNKAAST